MKIKFRTMCLALCTIYFILNSSYSQAQNCNFILSGITKEKHKPEPLSFAIIRVLELDTVVTSDDEGHYIFQNLCEGEYTLVCSYLGFRTDTQTVYINKDKGVFFNLHPENCELDEIVVQSNGVSTEIKLYDKTNESTYNEGVSLIKGISGASVLKTGNNTVKPINHGLHSSRLRVIQAGASIENQQWGEEHGLELSGLRNFILNDQNNLKYNHDGIGGVLIAEPTLDVNKDSVFKSQGFMFANSNSNGKSGKIGGELQSNLNFAPWLGFKVFGSIARGGDVHTPDYNLNNTGYKNYDYGFMIDMNHNKIKSTLFYSIVNQELGIFSGSHIENVTDFKNAINSSKPSNNHIREFDYLIEGPKQEVEHELVSYKLVFDEKFELQLSRQFNLREEFEGHSGEVPQVDLQLNLTTNNGDLRYYSKWNNWNSTFGINAMNQINTWGYREFIPNYEINRVGGYFLTEKDSFKNDKYAIQLGFRFDTYDNNFYLLSGREKRQYSNFSYSLIGFKRMKNNFVLSVNNGLSWRPPSANELFSDGVHHGAATFEKGDLDLKKEISYQSNLELSKSYTKLRGSAKLYGNLIDNFIYSQPTGDVILTVKGAFPFYQYVQTNAVFYGSDFSLIYELNNQFESTSKYTLIRTYDFNFNTALVGVNPSRIEQSFSYQSKYFNRFDKNNFIRNNWKFNIEAQYFFRKENTNYNLEFSKPPEGYLLFNSSIVYQIKNKKRFSHVNMRIGVENILNSKYRNYMNRNRFFADEMGRNFKLSLEIPFNIINKEK